MNTVEKRMEMVTYSSLVIIALAVFTSLSISAFHHILLVIPAFYFAYRNGKNWSLSMYAVLAVVLTIFLSVFFNWGEIPKPLKPIISAKYFLIPLLGIFAYRKMQWTDKRIKVILNSLLIATSIATICGIIGLYTGFTPIKMKAACHDERACGLYGMYMTYGYGIGLFMVLMTGALLYREKLKHYIPTWLIYSAWVINFAGLYLSYARGAWLGFLAALPFFFIKKNKKIFVIGFVVGAIALGALIGMNSKVRGMFFERQGSNEQRLAFFETAYVAFKEKPLFGWGYKNFEPNVKPLKAKYDIAFPDFQGHAHNNFLEHLASTGILGFLALIFFHIAWFKESLCSKRLIDDISLPFVIALIVSGMTQVTLGDGENLFLIMTLWSLGQVKRE